MNIFNKIYEIMNEYDILLDEKENNYNNSLNNYTHEEFEKNKNEYYNNIDNFFKYIFKNININNLNEKNNLDMNNQDINNLNTDNLNTDNLFSNNKDIIILSNNNLDSHNLEYNNNNNFNNNDDKQHENIIQDFIKKIYKKIILKCHPDKKGNEKLFIKCREYYENKFLIGILYIGFLVNYQLPELNQIIVNHILFEIRVIQEKIIYLKLELKKI